METDKRKRIFRWGLAAILTAVAVVGLVQIAQRNGGTTVAVPENEPARVQELPGGRSRLTLSTRAAQRLGLKTTPVRLQTLPASTLRRKVVPYSALLYDPDGSTWVYVNRAGLTFDRTRVGIRSIRGDLAVLSAGPAAGTKVVAIAAEELFGIEAGVDH
jgi:hypothetical protein